MQNQLSPYSTQYFQHIETQTKNIRKQIQAKDSLIQERNNFYGKSLASYQDYIDKQSKLLQKNIQHCRNRDKWFRNQVQKAWKTSISNRPLVLRSLARTNIAKREADEWIARMEDEVLGDKTMKGYHEEEHMNNSQLLNRYNDILNQYQLRY